jgi:hypothetical protein
LHVSGSSAFVTETHAPVPAAQVWQVPLQAPEQQRSSQMPETQSSPMEHAPPVATRAKSSALDRS